jgi:SAM-dependent methyltransferase
MHERLEAWVAWLASLPPAERDRAVEERLGLSRSADDATDAPPGDHMIGYHASGVASIVRALLEVPVVPADVVVDLGAGLGKVVLLTRLLTGATARGIELQGALVDRARAAASSLALDVSFTHADAREAAIDDATVFFLYVPFTGPVLAEVLRRLHAVARRRDIVVCALGVDLDRGASWLVARKLDAFWLSLYDTSVPGASRRARAISPLAAPRIASLAAKIAHER